MIDQDRIIALYDEYVRSVGGEVKSSEAMEAIRPQVVAMLADEPRDLDREAAQTLRESIAPVRGKRSRSLKENLDWFLDGFAEDGAYVDPLLDQAYGLGHERGLDKTLRFWTSEDFRNLVVTRYRVAADQTAAAKDIDGSVQRVVDRMQAQGATHFGDVAWGEPGLAA